MEYRKKSLEHSQQKLICFIEWQILIRFTRNKRTSTNDVFCEY